MPGIQTEQNPVESDGSIVRYKPRPDPLHRYYLDCSYGRECLLLCCERSHTVKYCRTLQEVADELNVSVNCVRKTEIRALRKLKIELQGRGMGLEDFIATIPIKHENPVCTQGWIDSVV